MSHDYQRKTARDIDTLVHTIESEAHKASELLRGLDAHHKEWDRAVATGKFEDANRAYTKLVAVLKAYERALVEATGSLELYEEETETHEAQEYPEKFG